MDSAADLLGASFPGCDTSSGAIDHYDWFCGTYAHYQVGGDRWNAWRAKVKEALLSHQRKDGNFAGSWDPNGGWGHDGGRTYSTALAALTLQRSIATSR